MTKTTRQGSIAIITARGGSKRIPHKNIRPFCGEPMIAYSIRAAKESGLFEEVMVSTEDETIAAIAREYGANVPFLRSEKNADDTATTAEVLTEVLSRYEADGFAFDSACCLYPTAPFLTGEILKEAKTKLDESGADTCMPLVVFSFPPQRGMTMENDRVRFVDEAHRNTRSQDLTTIYHDCGQFYFFRVEPFLQSGILIGDNTAGLVLPELLVQDIDNEEDFQIAEFKYKYLHRDDEN
ncbi:MAG: pseudaminic acid cytidylyltransferase [Lachnospiraceae bacterium]|nr:pseudaminic acid cytidylyltransferase [Lachnospiraceae bacterium]